MGTFLKPFDPAREFVTQTAFRAGGKVWGKGLKFDKSLVDERTLRLCYEQRKIVYDDDPRAIELLTRARGRGATVQPTGDPLDHDGDGHKGGSLPDTGGSEEEQVKRLMGRYNKAALLDLAKKIPGIQKSMNKTQIATALVRSGYGDS